MSESLDDKTQDWQNVAHNAEFNSKDTFNNTRLAWDDDADIDAGFEFNVDSELSNIECNENLDMDFGRQPGS